VAKFELILEIVPRVGQSGGRVQLYVEMEGDWPSGSPVWFARLRDDEVAAEQNSDFFTITEPGEYHVVGTLSNGKKLETQVIEVTAAMIAGVK